MTPTRFSQDDADIDLGRLFAAIWEKRLRLVVIFAIAGLAAFLLTTLMAPLYKGESRILIQQRDPVAAERNQPATDQPLLDERGVASQVEVIKSTDLIRQVARSLSLADRPEFDAAARPSLLTKLLVATGLRKSPLDTDPEERVLDAFREKLSVYQVENSRVIVIEFSSEDRELSAKVANALADAYLGAQSGIKLEDNADASAWLQPEIAKLSARVREAEGKVAEYRAKTGLLEVGQNDTLANRQLADVATELGKVRAERADAEARAANVRDALKSGRSTDSLAGVVGSSLVQRLRESEVAIQAQLADLSTTMLDGHPRIKALKAQLADIDRRIKAESRRVLESLESEAGVARMREEQLIGQMNTLKSSSAQAGEQEVELQALEREAAAERDLLNTYLARFRETSSRADPNALPADARIISRAVVPNKAYYPKTVPIIIVAMLAAFLVSAIAIMLSELFSGRALKAPATLAPAPAARDGRTEPQERGPTQDRSAALPSDPETAPAAPSWAEVTPAADEASDVPPPMDPARRFDRAADDAHVADPAIARAEAAYVAADANDQDDADEAAIAPASGTLPVEDDHDFSIAAAAERLLDRGAKRVVCVSPQGDDGSAASVVLARLLAEEGYRTIVLDMTASGCVTPMMTRKAHLPGISDLLTGDISFADAIHGDRISSAHFMPSGTAERTRALAAIERLPIVVDALADAYDIVVVECGTADAERVERLMARDGTELVLSVVTPDDQAVTEALSAFFTAGYSDLIVMMPDAPLSPESNGVHAA